jgi:hypothetical protein
MATCCGVPQKFLTGSIPTVQTKDFCDSLLHHHLYAVALYFYLFIYFFCGWARGRVVACNRNFELKKKHSYLLTFLLFGKKI